MQKRVLIPGAGGPGAVNMTRSLKAAPEPVFTVGMDASPFYIHLALTDERVLVPRADHEDRYIEAVRRIVREYDINFIMPNSSIEMEVLTRHARELDARMFVPSIETQHIAASKYETWRIWRQKGIPVPQTMLIKTREDVDKAFDLIPTRPIWFRGAGIPGKGIGGAQLPCMNPRQASGWIDFHNGWGNFLASEYLPGKNLTFLGIYHKGRLVMSQARQRDAYVIPHVNPAGITGAPAVSHTIHDRDVNDLGERATLAIDPGFTGAGFVDFKVSSDGRILPTELNAGRFGTTHQFYTAAGANFPYCLLKLAFNEPLPPYVRMHDVLPADLYWIRTLDAGPMLVPRDRLGAGILDLTEAVDRVRGR